MCNDPALEAEMLRASIWADLVGDPDLLPVDPQAIAGRLGVRVETVPLAPGVVSVIRQQGGQLPLLLVADDLDDPTHRVVCAHALGHWILRLGSGEPTDVVDHQAFGRAEPFDLEEEIFASQFASSLLTPAALVSTHGVGECLDDVAERFGVPASLMELRIGDLAVR